MKNKNNKKNIVICAIILVIGLIVIVICINSRKENKNTSEQILSNSVETEDSKELDSISTNNQSSTENDAEYSNNIISNNVISKNPSAYDIDDSVENTIKSSNKNNSSYIASNDTISNNVISKNSSTYDIDDSVENNIEFSNSNNSSDIDSNVTISKDAIKNTNNSISNNSSQLSKSFIGTIINITNECIQIQPDDGYENISGNRILIKNTGEYNLEINNRVKVYFSGTVTKTYPQNINLKSIEIL